MSRIDLRSNNSDPGSAFNTASRFDTHPTPNHLTPPRFLMKGWKGHKNPNFCTYGLVINEVTLRKLTEFEQKYMIEDSGQGHTACPHSISPDCDHKLRKFFILITLIFTWQSVLLNRRTLRHNIKLWLIMRTISKVILVWNFNLRVFSVYCRAWALSF